MEFELGTYREQIQLAVRASELQLSSALFAWQCCSHLNPHRIKATISLVLVHVFHITFISHQQHTVHPTHNPFVGSDERQVLEPCHLNHVTCEQCTLL